MWPDVVIASKNLVTLAEHLGGAQNLNFESERIYENVKIPQRSTR